MKKNIAIIVLSLAVLGLLWFKNCEDLTPYLKQVEQAQKAVNELQKIVNGE